MTNDENTYIGMSLPEGIRYITETGSIWKEACHQTKTRKAVGL